MSLYGAENEEAVYFLQRLRVWTRSGFVTPDQAGALGRWADPGLRRTGPFFRALLFLFTLIAVEAVFGMTLWIFSWRSDGGFKVITTVFAVLAWVAAEREAGKRRLYRHGVEEALALLGAGWSAVALHLWVVNPFLRGDAENVAACFLAAAAGLAIFWRFGRLYGAFIALAAGACAFFFLDLREALLRTTLALYFAGIALAAGRAGGRSDVARSQGRWICAAALLGVYVCLNLRLPGLAAFLPGGRSLSGAYTPDFSKAFYWATYGFIIALPAGLLAAGWRGRRRVFLDLGLVTGVLTLSVNKDYWGWTRYAWDPALLGGLLAGGAWLASKRLRGRKMGVTADDVWKPENHGLEAAAMVAGRIGAGLGHTTPSGGSPTGGGASGGGGAGGSY